MYDAHFTAPLSMLAILSVFTTVVNIFLSTIAG